MKVGNVLFWLGISLWVGGLATLALIVAPVVFRTAPSREVAGAIFGNALRVFSNVEIACALIAGAGLGLGLAQSRNTTDWVRSSMLGTMIIILLFVQIWLAPAMRDLQGRMGPADDARARFATLHSISEKAYGTNLLIGLALIVVSALRKSPV